MKLTNFSWNDRILWTEMTKNGIFFILDTVILKLATLIKASELFSIRDCRSGDYGIWGVTLDCGLFSRLEDIRFYTSAWVRLIKTD